MPLIHKQTLNKNNILKCSVIKQNLNLIKAKIKILKFSFIKQNVNGIPKINFQF